MRLTATEIAKSYGVDRRIIYYLREKGLVVPRRTAQIRRPSYNEEQVSQILDIWRFYKSGFPVEVAYKKAEELAEKGGEMIAIVMMEVPPPNTAEVVSQLKRYDQVVGAFGLWGEKDVAAIVVVSNEDELEDLMMDNIQPALRNLGLVSTRTFQVLNKRSWVDEIRMGSLVRSLKTRARLGNERTQ